MLSSLPNSYGKKTERIWKLRTKGYAIGRLPYIHPACDELYFMRVLLNYVRGPTSYEDIRTVDDIVYATFLEACEARGLLDGDKEYIEGIKESSEFSFGKRMRRFFAVMLLGECLQKPDVVWDATWEYLTDDILKKLRKDSGNHGMI